MHTDFFMGIYPYFLILRRTKANRHDRFLAAGSRSHS